MGAILFYNLLLLTAEPAQEHIKAVHHIQWLVPATVMHQDLVQVVLEPHWPQAAPAEPMVMLVARTLVLVKVISLHHAVVVEVLEVPAVMAQQIVQVEPAA